MTDRGILFTGPDVRANREGRKTQTRRLAWLPTEWAPGVACKHGHDACPICDAPKPTVWQRARPDDRLWVREAWKPHTQPTVHTACVYRAEYTFELLAKSLGPWRPSIHMPRWASRQTLVVTAVKVERLQDISEEDAKAEGIKQNWTCLNPGTGSYAHDNDVLDDFRQLWNSLHGKDAWLANPEVVAIAYETHDCNIDVMENAA